MCGRPCPINVIFPTRVIFRGVQIDRNTYSAGSAAARAMRRSLLLVWALFIVYATMLPFDFSANGDLIRWRLHRLWERPLRGGGGSWHDVYSNVLLFVPWGLLLGVCLAGRRIGMADGLGLGFAYWGMLKRICGILQVFAPLRHMSFIDLATNTLGSVMGALIGWPLARWIWPVSSVRIRQLLVAKPLAACALVQSWSVCSWPVWHRRTSNTKARNRRQAQIDAADSIWSVAGRAPDRGGDELGCRDSDLDADRWTFCPGRPRIRVEMASGRLAGPWRSLAA